MSRLALLLSWALAAPAASAVPVSTTRFTNPVRSAQSASNMAPESVISITCDREIRRPTATDGVTQNP